MMHLYTSATAIPSPAYTQSLRGTLHTLFTYLPLPTLMQHSSIEWSWIWLLCTLCTNPHRTIIRICQCNYITFYYGVEFWALKMKLNEFFFLISILIPGCYSPGYYYSCCCCCWCTSRIKIIINQILYFCFGL